MDTISDTQSAAVTSSRPIPNEQNENNEEEIQQQPQIKKKELSQKQIDHLNNIRVKALEKKREIN